MEDWFNFPGILNSERSNTRRAELNNAAGTPAHSKTIWRRKEGEDWHNEGGGGIQKQVKDIEVVEDEREGS